MRCLACWDGQCRCGEGEEAEECAWMHCDCCFCFCLCQSSFVEGSPLYLVHEPAVGPLDWTKP